MIEIPESTIISEQATKMLTGKVVSDVINATSPHRFAWFNGDAQRYPDLLIGKTVEGVKGYGSFIDICFDSEIHLTISDGTNMKYYTSVEKCPAKFQLLVAFEDGSYLVFTVAMYGNILAFRGKLDNAYYTGSIEKVSPMTETFDFSFFCRLIEGVKRDMSVKALLATEQRIPGLGNGVLQDILFNARIHPKRKISTLNAEDKQILFHSIKDTLSDMIVKGGRDTEKDFLGNAGRYRCILSKNTYAKPCVCCGSRLIKEAYLGGSVYYCPNCQH
ncbi:MAG: endonuclease VIII [Bacteroidales bacterium]|nr:endonuclease VIII [Bacteroidales bacterium]